MRDKILAVIPARYASTRLPGKALLDINGKSMIQHVWERVQLCSEVDKVLVATDDERIKTEVESFGGEAMMTSKDHQSGTDRIGEVAKQYPDYDIFINVQGDEPLISPNQIEKVVSLFEKSKDIRIATLIRKIDDEDTLFDFNVVKVVLDIVDKAIYFSRQAIPAQKVLPYRQWSEHYEYYHHIGIYGYRRDTLLSLAQLSPGLLEKAESLEQLRWIENGFDIYCAETKEQSIGVDTEEDLEYVRKLMSSMLD